MARHLLIPLFIITALPGAAQNTVSIGLFTGISMPFTFDQGINNDPRYNHRNDVKFCPIGINYGIDFKGYGFNVSPALISSGQNFSVVNIFGGYEGVRKIKMTYLNIPIGVKAHLINLRGLKLSFIAATGFAFLIDGEETITHHESKLNFPAQVFPNLPPDYVVESDGVHVPEVSKYEMLSRQDFKKYQINIAMGFRSDMNVSKDWRLSFDLRVNYGLLEPRTDTYISRLKSYSTLYDLPGRRRDVWANLNVCISRYMRLEKRKSGRKIKVRF